MGNGHRDKEFKNDPFYFSCKIEGHGTESTKCPTFKDTLQQKMKEQRNDLKNGKFQRETMEQDSSYK